MPRRSTGFLVGVIIFLATWLVIALIAAHGQGTAALKYNTSNHKLLAPAPVVGVPYDLDASDLLINGVASFKVTTQATFTSDQNNYSLPAGKGYYQRWSSDSARNVSGISIGQSEGTTFVILNAGGHPIVLQNESTGSAGPNRFHNDTGVDIELLPLNRALVTYDLFAPRWIVSPIGDAVLDGLGATLGAILYRDVTAWQPLGPSNDGFVLTTHGPGTISDYRTSGGSYILEALQVLGDLTRAQTFGLNPATLSATATLTNGTLTFVAVYLPGGRSITGVKWIQSALGSYTASNNNRIGLYTWDGAGLSLVASCANDATLWQTAASGTVGTKAFTTPYIATAGIYYVALLYCRSAEVTAPQLSAGPAPSSPGNIILDFSSQAKLFGTVASATDLPATKSNSAITAIAGPIPWVAIY